MGLEDLQMRRTKKYSTCRCQWRRWSVLYSSRKRHKCHGFASQESGLLVRNDMNSKFFKSSLARTKRINDLSYLASGSRWYRRNLASRPAYAWSLKTLEGALEVFLLCSMPSDWSGPNVYALWVSGTFKDSSWIRIRVESSTFRSSLISRRLSESIISKDWLTVNFASIEISSLARAADASGDFWLRSFVSDSDPACIMS